MLPAKIPEDEAARLLALQACSILDTAPEQRFDRLTRLTQQMFGTQIALVSLIDSERQWFKSRQGLDASETPRDISFCGHAILSKSIFHVADASKDVRFSDNPLVLGDPHIRFYAGAPLSTPDGYHIGTLCIIDTQPRQLSPTELCALRDLADCVEQEINQRQQQRQHDALLTLTKITSLPKADAPTLLHEALALGCGYLGMPFGVVSRIQGQDYEILAQVSPDGFLNNGQHFALSQTYCSLVLDGNELLALDQIGDNAYARLMNQQAWPQECYLGMPIHLDGVPYGTLSFSTPIPHASRHFTVAEIEFVRLLGGWVSSVLQQRVAKSRLRASQQELQNFFDLSPNVLCIAGVDGRFQKINSTLCQLLGYSTETLMRQPLLTWVHPDDLEASQREIKKIVRGEPSAPFVNRYRSQSGEYVSLVWSCAADLIAGKLYASAIEITRQQQAEQRLRDQAEHTQAILDNMVDGMLTITPGGLIDSVNPAVARIFGYPPQEVLGQHFSMLMSLPPRTTEESEPEPLLEVARIVGRGREMEGRRKGGKPFPMELSVSEVSRQGLPLYVGTVRDISDRKRIERMKSEFVSTVSHELRTPLTAISGALGLMSGGALGELPDSVRQMILIAHKNSQRLTYLINDLLDMEKLVAGEMPFNMQAQSLMPLIEQALEANRDYGAGRGVKLALLGEAPDVLVRIDSLRLMQVLSNLLSNAIKYSPDNETVTVSVALKERSVRLTVSDRGHGIPAEFHGRIFQKFAQADASDSRQKGGTGLGLAITRELVERMGGWIGFTSMAGKDTRFFFELPLWVAPDSTLQAPGEPE